tara:strand:+ start:1397 stop:1654 length:258 start_codon:yes stop_codon:yes gene_type:complete
MATKKIEEQTTEELLKAKKTHKTVIYILATLLLIYVCFVIYSLVFNVWRYGVESIIVPLMVFAGGMPALIQIKAINKELKKRESQ